MDRYRCNTSELRIVLIREVGDVESSVMDILLRNSESKKSAAENEKISIHDTEKCQNVKIIIEGQKMVVLSTPGLCDPNKSDKDVMKEIKNGVSKVSPHVFLLVLPLETFTEELQKMVELFKTTFGKSVNQYMMVVFPEGENLGEKTIEQFISENHELKKFVNDDCQKRYHVLHSENNQSQVSELVKEIQVMVKKNKGKAYVEVQARMRRIALSVNGFGVAGAAVGGVVSYFVASPIGIAGGLGVGAVVGAVVGSVGIFAVEIRKKRGCVLQ